MGMMKDMEQDERLSAIEYGAASHSGVSKVLSSLIGSECTVSLDFSEVKCKIIDVDEMWIVLTVYGKKKNETVVRRISDISKITLDKELI